MRWVIRGLLICIALMTLLCGVTGFWFFIYSADLPDFKAMARYAPDQPARVSGPCLPGDSIAIPYDAIGNNMRAALNAAEGGERQGQATVRRQISLLMFCDPSRMLERHFKEWRVAEQLRWRFSRNDLLTIYANRVPFGENLIGVEAASQHYFRKEPSQLDIAEAALLAGMIKGPSYYSPSKHPDRALERRNKVIAAMVAEHAITEEQGNLAQATGLSPPDSP